MSQTTPFPPLPDNSQYPNQMDYFNDYASFYPTSSAREEPNTFQPSDQTSATGWTDNQPYNTFTDLWGMPEQSGSVVGEPTNLLATTSYESLAPATSYVNQADGYSQPSYSSNYWPEVGQEAQSYYSGSLGQEFFFENTAASEPSIVIPAPGSVPFNYWEENQSGPSTSTFHTNVYTYHQPDTGPTRTGTTSERRFWPYERPRARRNEHRNAEAGPSVLMPMPFSCVGYPTLQPSGGVISETTADAEQNQKITEEDKVPAKPKRTKCPRGEGPPRHHRTRTKRESTKLSEWVQRKLGLRKAPVFKVALGVALEAIETIRVPVYSEHRLLLGQGSTRTAEGSKSADGERLRRDAERDLYKNLSKYYLLRPGQAKWTCPSLLSRVVKDLESIPTLPGPSDQPPP